MLFTQLFEDDFNKKPAVESVDDYDDCSYCSGTGEGRWEGSTCTHCQGSGVEPVSQDDDDFEEPDSDVADMDSDEESYYEKSLRSRGLGEQGVAEGRMAELDAEYQDYKKLSPREFYNMYNITKQAWFEKHKGFLKNISEADKKKDEPETRDVALQRAITRAKADFPTAGSGLEALAKDFMRSQDQDQKSFDQIRQAERKQNQMLDQISRIDQEQEQEIRDLENQNSTLGQRLQKLQSVNDQLEKKLAAISGRKQKRSADKSEPAPVVKPAPEVSAITPTVTPEPKAEPTTSKAIAQVAKTLAPPTSSAAIDQMAQQLQPRQKELGFDEPVTLKPKKYDTSKAADVDYRELTSKMARDIVSDPDRAQRAFKSNVVKGVAGQQEMPLENKEQKPEPPEADYGPEYQDMVSRVKKLAGQGPRKTVWDPVKRVYKTVPVNNDTK